MSHEVHKGLLRSVIIFSLAGIRYIECVCIILYSLWKCACSHNAWADKRQLRECEHAQSKVCMMSRRPRMLAIHSESDGTA